MEIHLRPDQEILSKIRFVKAVLLTPDEAVEEAIVLLGQQNDAEPKRAVTTFAFAPTQTIPLAPDHPTRELTGADLVMVLQTCPDPDADLQPYRPYLPVRDAEQE